MFYGSGWSMPVLTSVSAPWHLAHGSSPESSHISFPLTGLCQQKQKKTLHRCTMKTAYACNRHSTSEFDNFFYPIYCIIVKVCNSHVFLLSLAGSFLMSGFRQYDQRV